MALLESGRRNIVIIGAGFAGITALLKLRRSLARHGVGARYQLVLINKSSQHLYTPALYEIAAIPRGEVDAARLKSSVCIKIENILARFPNIHFYGDEAIAVNPNTHLITFRSGDQISFEYLVIALGAETNYFNIPGMREYAYPLKTFEDAVRLRNRIEALVDDEKDIEIVIGGGGATGVETAAEFTNFLAHLRRHKRGKQAPRDHVTIVEAAPEILQGFDPSVRTRTIRRLVKLGVHIWTGVPIGRVTETGVVLSGRVLPYNVLIWSGGVQPASALKNFRLALDKKGGVMVNEFLEARPRIYAVGDCSSFMNPETGKPPPWNVPVAEEEALRAADNIVADIMKTKKRQFRPHKIYPFVLAVGGKYAITDLGAAKLFGFIGWVLKQAIELRYLLSILPVSKALALWMRTVYYTTTND